MFIDLVFMIHTFFQNIFLCLFEISFSSLTKLLSGIAGGVVHNVEHIDVLRWPEVLCPGHGIFSIGH